MEKQETQPKEWSQKSWETLSKVRKNSPLIQCITNFVSMDLAANTLLAAGASPAMLHSFDEIPDFTPQVAALYINVGTLTASTLPAMKSAAEIAVKNGKPWVFDPVAAGCSSFRLRACLDLLLLKPTVVRGNGSEIIALSRASFGDTKGADSVHESMDALEAAKSLALKTGAVVAVTGAVDIVTDGKQVIGARNGVQMLQKITATGCSVTALISAFVAVDPTHAFEATVAALSVFGIAGELGMQDAKGPASLRVNLIDSLYGLDQESILQHAKISSLS
ncbi:hydroxyethylthiazole kinase-like [Chenopodium quinoa]|uniref:Hydroxyethylthiazole kinase n=1 Tax=Chenopodium quinoa TaxID=63459 RepID=A0A803MVK1_CHEQI|nr:hydroxyethylthiazole kinase-like [Chenopodium quinoa]